MTQVENELTRLKALVREFIKETNNVPFRATDCNQDTVRNLLNQLTRATSEQNDRQRTY
jgi:hypothetical protein